MFKIFIRQFLCASIIFLLFSCFFFGGGGSSYEFNSAKTYARIDKDLKAAEEWGLKALDMEPNNALIPYFLATEVYTPLKKRGEVAAMYIEALQRTENLKLDRPFKSGDEFINNVHDAIKNEASVISNEAIVLYNKGKKSKALPKFELSMKLNPEIVENYMLLSDISLENGDIDKAIEYIDKGLAVNNMNDFKIRKALCARKKEDYDLALSVLKGIVTDDKIFKIKTDKEILMIYMDQKDYLKAADFGDNVLERMFNSLGIDDLSIAETCYNVAVCNRNLGIDAQDKALQTINSATTDKDEINNSIKISEDAIKYFEIAKERFYDASSYSAEYLSSTTYAKDLNKQIKQLEELILPGLMKSLEQ